MARRKQSSLLSPRYWPTWTGLGLLWLNAKFNSYGGTLALGAAIGRIGQRLMSRRRHIAEVNISLCFPELQKAQQRQLVKEHFESLGISLLLLGYSWWAKDEKLSSLVHSEGLENIRSAVENGDRVIMLGMHFTDLDIIGRLLAKQQKIAVVYRRHGNPVIEFCFKRHRERCFVTAIPRGDIRGLLRTLKSHTPVWYATDQATGGKHSALIPFFGVPASTNTGTSRLARMSNAVVIPAFGYRLPGKQGFKLVARKPLEHFPSDDPVADTLRINQEIEEAVKLAPAQYLWIHRRFKKRRGIPYPYSK